jgi:hypothetical protein
VGPTPPPRSGADEVISSITVSPRCAPFASRSFLRRVAGLAAVGLAVGASALVAAPGVAEAYPTSVVFAPTAESLAFGSFATGLYSGVVLSPDPVFGSAWSGLELGVVPTIDIATTPAGKISFAGAEIGFDLFGPDELGRGRLVFNVKLQLLKETRYLPAIAAGFFQLSPDKNGGASLGFFNLSKSFSAGDTELGQLTFGMMRSFADAGVVAPRCFVSGARACLFRGSSPFVDENGAFLVGYLSPWFGSVGFSIDHLGGTSAVSSTNFLLTYRLWEDHVGGVGVAGIGAFLSNDRRDVPEGPGALDGVFATFYVTSSLTALFGWDPTKEWTRDPRKPRTRRGRRDIEDILEAPPVVPPGPTPPPEPPSEAEVNME